MRWNNLLGHRNNQAKTKLCFKFGSVYYFSPTHLNCGVSSLYYLFIYLFVLFKRAPNGILVATISEIKNILSYLFTYLCVRILRSAVVLTRLVNHLHIHGDPSVNRDY